uniref:Uncharacterized protein n=1 Tax=Sus scrofa TaxID=9823 RepID=A0A8D1ZL36_PIG
MIICYSLGYLYVIFQQTVDRQHALDTMNFDVIKSKPVRVTWSQHDPSLCKSEMSNKYIKFWDKSIYLFIYFYFLLFKATPVAYGGSQAKGQIRATAAGLHHSYSNAGFKMHLQPTPHSSWHQILNPRERPGIKSAASWFLVGFISAAP